jgi:ATP-dependent DNA helicase RecG
MANGEAQLAVGTHALFQDGVSFSRLGLVIVDEQHRFGVGQRLALKQKGQEPHQLMMSATPIPRTLAMSFYADLDVSVIDELPPGARPSSPS